MGYGKVLWLIKEESRPVLYVETGVTEENHGFYLCSKGGHNASNSGCARRCAQPAQTPRLRTAAGPQLRSCR